jgi:hypothetical protein
MMWGEGGEAPLIRSLVLCVEVSVLYPDPEGNKGPFSCRYPPGGPGAGLKVAVATQISADTGII